MKRRDFLLYVGAGGTGGILGFLLSKFSRSPGAKLIPALVPDPDIIPGLANWYAGVCTMCSAGCGTLVKVMEGRVKKVEGNPNHPVNKGKLCALGQAAPQAHYNPDRVGKPLRRSGERGSGFYSEISWDEAISTIAKYLSENAAAKGASGLYLLTNPQRGTLGELMNSFMSAYGSTNRIDYELFGSRNLSFANDATIGQNILPHYDIENTKYLLAFGADFASSWLSPVNYSDGYGKMRQVTPGGRGKLVCVEPRMSLTGANADEWVPAKPGTEAVLALSIAYAIVEKGHGRGGDVDGWRRALSKYAPKNVAEVCDVTAERIYHIAEEFASARPSLAIGGDGVSSYTNGISTLMAINILNQVAGNNGIKGGVLANEQGAKVDYKSGLTGLLDDAAKGKVKALFIHKANPVFTTPSSAKAAEALKGIPLVVALGNYRDETAVMADIILPIHSALEDWGDDVPNPGVGFPARSISQPAVAPFFDSKSAGDIFIETAKKLGGKFAERFKAATFAEHLMGAWKEAYSKNKAMSASAITFDEFWAKTLKQGGFFQPDAGAKKTLGVSSRSADNIKDAQARFEGAESTYPLYLTLYAHTAHRDGVGANIPWMQELPDPMTSVVWGNWVELNPKTAARFNIKEGELVTIESPNGRISAPAYIYPGIRPDTIAMPVGQGHARLGRYANDRGDNPINLLPNAIEPRTGTFALNSTRVRISSTNLSGDLVKTEGSTKELGRNIVQTVSSKSTKGSH